MRYMKIRPVVGDPFPKRCSCGIFFKDREAYIDETELPLSGIEYGEAKGAVLEFRNCKKCRSTLMLEVIDMRDYSLAGISKRKKHIAESYDA